MNYFLETTEIIDGKGVLSVRGAHDPVLLMHGEPIAMHWFDNEGSIGRYLVRSGQNEDSFDLEDYRYVVEGGFDAAGSLSGQFGLILNLFDNGPCNLTLNRDDESFEWELYEFSEKIDYGSFLENFYPQGLPLVATRVSEAINEARVAEFVGYLECGMRPIIVTASTPESKVEFIIDGHHKLVAYKRAGIAPRILNICRPNTLIRIAEAVSYIRNKRAERLYLSRFE